MSRTIRVLPPELTMLIFTAGRRRIVLVEGPDDKYTFEQWYQDQRSKIAFFDAGGGYSVEFLLNEALAASTTKHIYGIIDRDFRSDTDVEARLLDPNANLYILRRYDLENYLLEPSALHEALSTCYGRKQVAPDLPNIESILLQLCQELCVLVAANWVFSEERDVEHFGEGFPIGARPLIIQESAKRLGCNEEEVDKRIAAREALIQPHLVSLELAHTRIKGKLLLYHVHRIFLVHQRIGVSSDILRNFLVRATLQHGIHADITAIINERILAAQ